MSSPLGEVAKQGLCRFVEFCNWLKLRQVGELKAQRSGGEINTPFSAVFSRVLAMFRNEERETRD